MKRIPYGITDYKKLIEDGCYYVDKTMYLEKLKDITNKKLVYFRPRRFGKTILTSMMYYYDIDRDLGLDYTKSSDTILARFLYKSNKDKKIYIIIDEAVYEIAKVFKLVWNY